MGDAFLDDLNAAVKTAFTMPRVRFEASFSPEAEAWIKRKHANGAVHEPATIAAFLAAHKHRPDAKIIFDVGSLWGYFALLAAGLFPEADVTAFDAHPAVMPALAFNTAPFVQCVHAAVTDENRPGVLHWLSGFNLYEKPPGGWQDLENIPGAMKQRGENNRGRGWVRVDLITLDAYCQTHGLAPDLIKIDVEGYQAKAVLGAVETLRQHRPIVIMELHDPEKVQRMGTTNKATVQPLFDLGYRGYWCGNHRATDATFERVHEMSEAHERLSIMAFVAD